MLVSINPERMLVQIDRNLGSHSESLAWAVQETLALHDALIEGVSRRMKQGIDIVDDAGLVGRGYRPAHLQGLRRAHLRRRGRRLRRLQYAPSPRLLGLRRHCSIYGCNGKVGVRE